MLSAALHIANDLLGKPIVIPIRFQLNACNQAQKNPHATLVKTTARQCLSTPTDNSKLLVVDIVALLQDGSVAVTKIKQVCGRQLAACMCTSEQEDILNKSMMLVYSWSLDR